MTNINKISPIQTISQTQNDDLKFVSLEYFQDSNFQSIDMIVHQDEIHFGHLSENKFILVAVCTKPETIESFKNVVKSIRKSRLTPKLKNQMIHFIQGYMIDLLREIVQFSI